MVFEKVLSKIGPKLEKILKDIYDKGYDEGYKDATGTKWHFVKNDDYPPDKKIVICHGWLTTTYGEQRISEKTFLGYYKKDGFGWFIKNEIDGESDQAWPVDCWREIDKPPAKVR